MPEPITDLINLDFQNYRRVWKPFMEKYNCQTVCEIGVFEGENFERMIEHNPSLAVAIDPWVEDGIISRNDTGEPQRQLDNRYNVFLEKMKDNSFVKVFRAYSFEAVKQFPDHFFDLIYIDADHTYEGALKDILDWYPKVKYGGFLTGDDYRRGFSHGKRKIKIGVKDAVNQFAKQNNLTVYELPRRGWAIIK